MQKAKKLKQILILSYFLHNRLFDKNNNNLDFEENEKESLAY